MLRHRLRVPALLLVLCLLAPWASLSASPLARPPHGETGLLASLWGGLVSLWSAAGCEMDPNGKPACIQASVRPAGRLGSVRFIGLHSW